MASYDEVYRKNNMAPKFSKRVRKCIDGATVWGAQIFGERGIVGNRVSKHWINAALSTFVALDPTTSREVIESIAGNWNASMVYHRSCFWSFGLLLQEHSGMATFGNL